MAEGITPDLSSEEFDNISVDSDAFVEGTSGETITIVVVGETRSGKSFLIRELLYSDDASELSPTTHPITHKISLRWGDTFNIVDTVGLPPDDENVRKVILKELSSFTKEKADAILLCIPVSLELLFSPNIPTQTMRSLTLAYGKNIWRHCVVVFTFSNTAQDYFNPLYQSEITAYTSQFEQELRNLNIPPDVTVKTIFESHIANCPTIVTIPAGYNAGMEEDWTHTLFLEVIKIARREPEKSILKFRYNQERIKDGLKSLFQWGARGGTRDGASKDGGAVAKRPKDTFKEGSEGQKGGLKAAQQGSEREPDTTQAAQQDHGQEDTSQRSTGRNDQKEPTEKSSAHTDADTGDDTGASEEKINEEDFIQEIEEATYKNDRIARKLAHGMFVGPTGAGKSSLMDRLLGRPRKEFSPSTGVSEPVVVVDVDIDNPSTFHSVTVMEGNTWKEVEYDESLVRQMGKESFITATQPVPSTASFPTQATPYLFPYSSSSQDNAVLHTETESAKISIPPKPAKIVTTRSFIKQMIGNTIKKYGGYKRFKHFLQKTFSLYLRDTGGQVEFQEMLPLLIFGPSIFFFVFRLDLDFKKKFRVEYRKGVGESLNCYTSSITTEEAFLQCLASVYAMDRPGNVKTHKPLVFIIGTHKDKLGPSADEKIASLNRHLGSLIESSGFGNLVLSADRGKSHIMFTVDNTADSDKDFELIRSKVSSLIRGREEFTIEYPIRYLLFCLELQNVKRSVLSLAECKVMAAKYGIEEDQLLHLLEFLHLRIGTIRYFDKDGVRHIVIKEPQVLFNKVTDLIVETFSSEALTDREADDFEKKGILTASVFANVVSDEDHITSEEFLKLLVHLRITAPFTTAEDQDRENRFFIPSVLNHVPISKENWKTNILPLAVKFKCEHCPKGLFGVLVTHLMNPDLNEGATTTTTFTLMQDKIFKDQVSFEVQSTGVHDEMALKVHPSHLEIKFFPEHSKDRDTSITEVCSNIRQITETSIHQSLQDLHYSKNRVDPVMCFRCEDCSELHPVEKGKKSIQIYCKKIDTTVSIPPQGECWYSEAHTTTADKPLTNSPALTHPVVKRFLKSLSSVEIRNVGVYLGLSYLTLKSKSDECLLDEMVCGWLRKDDIVSETSGTPSWESLAKALEEAGYNGVAANIRKEMLP